MGNSAYEKLFGVKEVDPPQDLSKYATAVKRLYRNHAPDAHDEKRVQDEGGKKFANEGTRLRFHVTVSGRMTKADKALRRARAFAEAGLPKFSAIYFRRWFRLSKERDTLLIRKLPEENDWALAWINNISV